MTDYAPRLVDRILQAGLATFPAILLVGPRACGKTTTAVRLTESVVRLDDPIDANRYRLAPDDALAAETKPVLIDEWQVVPDVLGAVKRAVDGSPDPGKFLITGSVQAESTLPTWPLTGRAQRIRMYGLTEREIQGDAPSSFLDGLRQAGLDAVRSPARTPAVTDYIANALAGTLPYPRLHLEPPHHHGWYASYIDHVVFRDLGDLEPNRDPVRLRRFLQAYALNTAGVTPLSTLYEAADVGQRTAIAYEGLLNDLFLVDDLPAFTSNRLKRLTRMPKRTLVEPALLGPLSGADAKGILGTPDLLGRLLETYVIAQLRPEAAALGDATLFHLRDQGGRSEIDLLIEFSDGRVIGIEVKATSTPSARAARHLIDLRDALGERFICGLVLHTGRGVTPLDDRIAAAPISTLWT